MFCGICCENNNNVFVCEMADNQKDDVYPSFIVRLSFVLRSLKVRLRFVVVGVDMIDY